MGQGRRHILHNTVEMVKNTRIPADLDFVYDLMLTLVQYGADPNKSMENPCKKAAMDFLSYYVFLISRKVRILSIQYTSIILVQS